MMILNILNLELLGNMSSSRSGWNEQELIKHLAIEPYLIAFVFEVIYQRSNSSLACRLTW
jgi:hypothetical protein